MRLTTSGPKDVAKIILCFASLPSLPPLVSLLGAARPSRVVRATISFFPPYLFFSIFLSSPSSRPSSSSSLPLISPPSYPVRPSIIGHQRIAGSKMRYYQNTFAFILGAVCQFHDHLLVFFVVICD